MRRVTHAERAGWQARLEEIGFDWHTTEAGPYWREDAAWVFTLAEIENDLERPTAEIEDMCMALVDRALGDEATLTKLAIPREQWDFIADSWKRGDRNIYGRLDLAYDGTGPAKLLEYNADTPTSLLEASVAQWMWLEDRIASGALPKEADQFNSLHERLIQAFHQLHKGKGYRLHLAEAVGSVEDTGTVNYLAECARQAGVEVSRLLMHQIGLARDGRFTDARGEAIENLFKLYPWEWMFRESFGAALARCSTRFVEPPWKAILSNKGLLPLLWQMAPGHPNLLPAFFSDDPQAAALGAEFVEKPLFSREGANVRLRASGESVDTGGPYGAEGSIRQAVAPLAKADGGYAVIGSWLVASEPAGIGIREDAGMITRDTARFVPHVILG